MSNVELLAGIILFLMAAFVVLLIGAWLFHLLGDLFEALFGLTAFPFRTRLRGSCSPDCTEQVCTPACRYYSELRPRETHEHRLRRVVLQGRIDWQEKHPDLRDKPCICGQVWRVERDTRIVNNNRDPNSIELKFCPCCWQLLEEGSNQKLADSPWIAW